MTQSAKPIAGGLLLIRLSVSKVSGKVAWAFGMGKGDRYTLRDSVVLIATNSLGERLWTPGILVGYHRRPERAA